MEQLTSKQLAEWEVYDTMDPIGDFRDDAKHSILMSHITNLFIGAYGKKGAKMTEPKDYIVDWDGSLKEQEEKGQSVEEMKDFLLAFAESHNRRVDERMKKRNKT